MPVSKQQSFGSGFIKDPASSVFRKFREADTRISDNTESDPVVHDPAFAGKCKDEHGGLCFRIRRNADLGALPVVLHPDGTDIHSLTGCGDHSGEIVPDRFLGPPLKFLDLDDPGPDLDRNRTPADAVSEVFVDQHLVGLLFLFLLFAAVLIVFVSAAAGGAQCACCDKRSAHAHTDLFCSGHAVSLF